MTLRIGEVAARSGSTATAIRYYESIGLMAAPRRSRAGYRRYGERAVEEVLFIRKAQVLGFSLDEVREILTLARSGRRPCDRVRALARRHLDVVDERLARLTAYRAQLATLLEQWTRDRTAPTDAAVCGWVQGVDEGALAGGGDRGRNGDRVSTAKRRAAGGEVSPCGF